MRKIQILVAFLPLLSACETFSGYGPSRVGKMFSPQEILVFKESPSYTTESRSAGASGTAGQSGSSAKPVEKPTSEQAPADKSSGQVIPVTERMIVSMLFPDGSDQSLEAALSTFYENCKKTATDGTTISDPFCKLTRNRIQDRIIFSSNSACRIYKNNLKQFQAIENTAFGSVTTLLGGIGAMTTAAFPARVLSGGAGISSGLNHQVNENVYSTLAVEVITKAIDKARLDELREITKSREQNIDNYTIERAIADADLYHSRCSLLSGLQEASTSVNKAGSPSASDLNDVLKQLNQSVTLKLGQNSADVFNGQTVFASAVCESNKTKFEDFLRNAGTDQDKPRLKSQWDEIYNINCKDSKSLDDKLIAAFKNYSTSTDDSARQSYANAASILQLQIKNMSAILESRLQSIAINSKPQSPG